MTLSELQSMTVIQLRKLAREKQIILGAGLEKAAIVEKIALAMNIPMNEIQQSLLDLPELSVMPAAESESALPENTPSVQASSDSPAVGNSPLQAGDAAKPETLSPGLEDPSEKTDLLTEKADMADAGQDNTIQDQEDPSAAQKNKAEGNQETPFAEEPRFQAAWHSPDAGPLSAPHASYTSTGTARPAWMNTTPSGRPLTPEQRQQPLRTHSFGPRFGPAAGRSASASDMPDSAPVSAEKPIRPVRQAASPLPDHRIGLTGSGSPFGPSAAGTSTASSASASSAASAPVASPAPAPEPAESAPPTFAENASAPTLEELLSSGEFEEGSGILELHPDGYGFLRASHFMPSSRDIYVSMAQIRRFSLRTGDFIQGKIRPQREGDKYAALLYIDTVNGLSEEEAADRPLFDELTPVYPSRRMSLEAMEGPSAPDMRLIDLIAPLGFGQRGLLLCPPETGKYELLQHYANTITANYPDASVLILLIDMTPEDVTAFRDSVSCPVIASTFDLVPEAHLRLTEMVVERAMRLVEQKKDVVILADSLTRLAKIFSTSAVQQGRSVPGMVNPASLFRAKRMFGSARALKEGGSLTVIATMDVSSGNKVDDSVVEEFKGTANMELALDASLARAGVFPAIRLEESFTKNSDLLLNPQQKEGLSLIRQMLSSTSSANAIPQLLSMMDKTSTNSELLLKMKDWFALMNM